MCYALMSGEIAQVWKSTLLVLLLECAPDNYGLQPKDKQSLWLCEG